MIHLLGTITIDLSLCQMFLFELVHLYGVLLYSEKVHHANLIELAYQQTYVQ